VINTRVRVINVSSSRKLHHLVKLAAIGSQILKAKVFRQRIPIVVSIHVTNKCNLRCKYCYSNIGGRFNTPPEDFSTAELKAYFTEMKRLGTRWIVFLGGEPMLRKDLGELIHHVNNLGMLSELVTNGTLIEEYIEQIKDVDLLCISLDGDSASNDAVRGNGSFKRALKGLEIATSRGIKTRVHAVFTRFNTNDHDLNTLSEIAARFKTTFGFSSPITINQDTLETGEYLVDAATLSSFIRLIKQYKTNGKPVYNSHVALDFIGTNPPSMVLIRGRANSPNPRLKRKACFAGDRFCYVDSEGFVYPCIESGVKTGLNIREVGFKNAFDHLKNIPCKSCNHIQYFEANDILGMKWTGFVLGMKTLVRGST
jgi:MoaA/NifB/PqqE/SkfB family radical SAM enzyme